MKLTKEERALLLSLGRKVNQALELSDIRKLAIPSWDSLKVDQLGFIKIEGVENGR